MPEDATIPVIGARTREAKIHAVTVQAVMTCDCQNDAPMVIAGFDRKVTCSHCGRVYVIQRIDYAVDIETGEATLHQAIAQVGEAPAVRLAKAPVRGRWN